MEVNDINPFLRASVFVFEQFQIKCSIADVEYESSSDLDVLLMIGLTGDISGQALIRIPAETGLKIASAMMGGMEVPELDQMAQSALLELTNMICGNAITELTEQGVALNITPPTLLVGNSVKVSGAEVETLTGMITIQEAGTVELSLMFEN